MGPAVRRQDLHPCSRAATRPARAASSSAIMERVNPRVFRVVALPAADGAGKDAALCAALPAAPAGGGRGRHLRPQLVQPRRRRAGDGLLHRGAGDEVPRRRRRRRARHGRQRHHPAQVLAGSRARRNRPAASRRASTIRSKVWKLSPMDVLSYEPLVRLFAGPRRDVRGERYRLGAVVRGGNPTTRSAPASTSSATSCRKSPMSGSRPRR